MENDTNFWKSIQYINEEISLMQHIPSSPEEKKYLQEFDQLFRTALRLPEIHTGSLQMVLVLKARYENKIQLIKASRGYS